MSQIGVANKEVKHGDSDVKAKKTITWDDFHNSPQAEIVLVSEDMVGFRVYAWYMKRKCDFIRDLLDLPSDQSIDQAPIHVRQSAKIVRTFVDCATSSHEHDFKVDPTDLVGFADLCDHLQAQTIKSTVLDNLKKQMKSDPYRALGAWNIFKWAAKEADLELARLAITSFDRSDIVVRDLFVERSTTFFDDIPPRYVFALLRSFADPAMNRHGQGGRVHDAIIFRSSIDAANAFTLD